MKKRRMRGRYILFGVGAAIGSAIGLILGSLLTFWIGEETLRAVQGALRRLTGNDDRPNFEMLIQ